jgi:predicted O-methyltransferase YrrM
MARISKSMNITDRLKELDSTLVEHNEGDWKSAFDPYKGGFSSFNDAGIECETGEFLYSMVRLLKPDRVLETGTHWGVGASYMGLGVQDNNHGHVYTVEFLKEIHERAKERIHTLGLDEWVTCTFGDVAQYIPLGTYKLILLDTEPQTRFAELVKFYQYLEPGGFVFIHDLNQHMHQIPNEEHGFAWPYGKIPEEMHSLVTSGKLRPFHFSTPRGLTGFYKVDPRDYKW